MINKTAFGIAAGLCGSIFIGYCIYFDQKRRNDPSFKQKLRERRQARKTQQRKEVVGTTKLPNLKDPEAVQRFFLQEIQLGEELLQQGDFDNSVEHLCNAVAICGQPQQLLQVLQQTLPPQVFALLVKRLPMVTQKIAASASTIPEEDELE